MDSSEGRLYADSKGFLFYETSAKTGHNVITMFEVQCVLAMNHMVMWLGFIYKNCQRREECCDC